MNVENIVDKVLEEIKDSEEYKEYQKVKERINENKDLKNQLDDFRKMQVEQQKNILNGINNIETEKKIKEIYTNISINPDISRYLNLEYEICEVVSEIYQQIGEKIDLDWKI